MAHDPRNEPDGPIRNGNANPGAGHDTQVEIGDGGGSREQPRDLFGSYDADDSASGRAWREGGREKVEEWFDDPEPHLIDRPKGTAYQDSSRSRLENLLDHMYTQAMTGGLSAQKLLVEIRIGKTVAAQEIKTGGMGDGVAFGEQAAKMQEALRQNLLDSGVSTELIDKATEDYLWSNDRAEESPADDTQEA